MLTSVLLGTEQENLMNSLKLAVFDNSTIFPILQVNAEVNSVCMILSCQYFL